MYQQLLMQQKQNEMQNELRLQQQQKQQMQQQMQRQGHQPQRNLIRQNQQDIDRSRMLYQQKYLNQNYQPVELDLDSENDSDSDSDDEDQNETKQIIIYDEVPHFIAISSLDRNWEENEPNTTQYNFQLKFAPSSNTISVLPLYQNNPTIPATKEQALNGNRGDANNNGWVDENGINYPVYNPSEPFGEIVQYEKIIELGQKGLALYNSFKNIVSIELVSAIMPSVQRQIDYSPTLKESCIDESYYIMEIDEINDVMDGTSKDLKNAFSIISPVIRIYDISAMSAKSVEYKPAGLWAKRFTPSPLSSLTNLTIKIKKPSGDIIKNLNDTLDIKFVYQYQSNLNDSRTDVLVIQTTQYFSENEYKPTDTIIIRNYSHYSDSSNISNFNDWMNRQSGHKILALSNDDSSKYLKNRIHIARPAYLDINTGGLTEESWYTDFKNNGLDTPSTIDNITTYDSGRLINIDLQNLYFFKITTKEHKIMMESERV